MRETLRPRERIRKKKEFLTVYKKGRRYRGKYFNLIFLSNNLTFSRVGVVVSRKIGDAVRRNKIKRWLRTLFRTNKELLRHPMDIVIIAYKEIRNVKWQELKSHYLNILTCLFGEDHSDDKDYSVRH